jgi:hypothetical protein
MTSASVTTPASSARLKTSWMARAAAVGIREDDPSSRGATNNSPALQRWESQTRHVSPGGTAESRTGPSVRRFVCLNTTL